MLDPARNSPFHKVVERRCGSRNENTSGGDLGRLGQELAV
jgi:hypothetical protein